MVVYFGIFEFSSTNALISENDFDKNIPFPQFEFSPGFMIQMFFSFY